MDMRKTWRLVLLTTIFIGILGAKSLIEPIPKTPLIDQKKALLGKMLFFDPKLSKDGTVACASCHNTLSGADRKALSIGVFGKKGSANAPSVFNSRFNFRQMWNGRAKDLKEQVRLPITNPIEMDMDIPKIERYLRSDPRYASLFEKIYHRKANFEDMSDAIAEFEKALITPDSRFDRYLRGEITLSPKEMRGWRLFKSLGCITCHNGINIGGNSFQKLGLINPYPRKKGSPDRYALTRSKIDKNIYKVPSLRNVALSAPYFHDGSIATLKEAIEKMAHYNLGLSLSDEQTESLLAFLKSLTGKCPAILKEDKTP